MSEVAIIYRTDHDEYDTGYDVTELLGWIDPENIEQVLSDIRREHPPKLENRAAYMREMDPEGKICAGYPRFSARVIKRIGVTNE